MIILTENQIIDLHHRSSAEFVLITLMFVELSGVGLYFSSLHWLKAKLGKSSGDIGALEAVMMGVIARSMSGVVLIPITVIKTR